MPFILDNDEDRYYDAEELRQVKRGTGLFPPGHIGRGLFPPGHKAQPSGYGYEVTGEGVLDSLLSIGTSIGSTIAANKDLIGTVAKAGTAAAGAASKIADTVKAHKNQKAAEIAARGVINLSTPQKIDLSTLQKIRQEAGLPASRGSGFRFT